MRCGCARTGSANNTTPCESLPLGEVMGAFLPKPPSGELSREAFFHQILIKPFQGIWGVGTVQVGKLQPCGDCMWQQETLMLLQTLSTRDPDELAEGFRR